jgi:C4-dicarboxylate-specific signal transduction histidine kinase
LRILREQPVRLQVIGVVTLLIVPLTAALVWSAFVTLRERETELSDEAKSVAVTATTYLNQFLDSVDTLASVLTRDPDVRALRQTECSRLFAQLLADQPLVLNIVLATPDRMVRASALPRPPAALDSPLPFDYILEVARTGRALVSDLTQGPTSHKPTVILAYPVRGDDGSTVGVLSIGLHLQQLQKVFAAVPLPAGSVITLSDRSSRVLARSLDPERYIGTTLNRDAIDPKSAPAAVTVRGADGVVRLYGNAVVGRGPWLLSVGIPRHVALERLMPLWRRNITISALSLVAVFLLSLWLADHLSRQLGDLRAAAQRIADGDLSPPHAWHAANREVAELQRAFATMAANLRDARDALDRQVEQERKMRDVMQSLQRQVVRQERLAAVGLLVSGVAHELNNPLQAILGTLELLERHPSLNPELLDEVAFVKTQSGRAREIIRNLSRFSTQQSGPPASVDLRDVIAEVVHLRKRDLETSAIALEVDVASVRRVQANFTELEQVILNFVINAQQAIEASGRLKGRIKITVHDTGKKVRLEVLDDGPGVRTEDEPKLFQPFFTTKPVGKGTGLGLSVSYGIIDSYGGSIGYRRNEWGGGTFFFELPAASDAAISASDHDGPPVLQRPLHPRV